MVRGVTDRPLFLPALRLRLSPAHAVLHARLSITEELVVGWNFEDIAPEMLL
jgi:hypothetical protein